ncbi:MAG: DUF4388 domain-containing protein [Anaeromyxobacter sp.]
MALKGTLRDFGIAEILQLIAQQSKSGVLHLESREDKIHIAIAEGSVVRAEATGRRASERLGQMLVRAELITEQELDHALELQRRTLRRLGDLMVSMRYISQDALREITALQTTETVYRLFHWKRGTYEFEPGPVDWDKETVTPLRAESVLMEGFRRVDEWPMVRQRVPSLATTFVQKRSLEEGAGSGEGQEELATLGGNERRVHELATAGRTAEKIVDLSRLGEFEACKALATLVNLGYLEAIAPAGRAHAVGVYAQDWGARLRTGALRAVATVLIAAALAGIAYWLDERRAAVERGQVAVEDLAPERLLARHRVERFRTALEIYRVERGEYPETLDALVKAGISAPDDVRFPWVSEYHYRRQPDGRFVLLPPLR